MTIAFAVDSIVRGNTVRQNRVQSDGGRIRSSSYEPSPLELVLLSSYPELV
jgi:hypothetical protein